MSLVHLDVNLRIQSGTTTILYWYVGKKPNHIDEAFQHFPAYKNSLHLQMQLVKYAVMKITRILVQGE